MLELRARAVCGFPSLQAPTRRDDSPCTLLAALGDDDGAVRDLRQAIELSDDPVTKVGLEHACWFVSIKSLSRPAAGVNVTRWKKGVGWSGVWGD